MQGQFKRIEFGQTPSKPTQLNEFQSSQRQKYENVVTRPIYKETSRVQIEHTNLVSKELYELLIPVKVKQQNDDWNTQLNLKILLQQQPHGQMLHLELTDDTNYQFLQVLDLTENEFISLKNEQSLHVDFGTFPNKLADILQLCINSQKDEKVSFYVNLETKNNESTLAVIENNEFKRLTHLALRFRSATDEILKNFLSQKLAKERLECEELYKRNRKLDEGLQERNWENDNLRAELRKFQEERDSTVQQLLLEEQKKINELKEQQIAKETNFVRESEHERKLIIDKYEKTIHDLQHKNHQLYQSNQELTEIRNELSQSERELKNKLTNLNTEINQLYKEVSELRQTNKELDLLKYSQERNLIELRIQKESLEKIMNEKEQYIGNKQQLVENEKKQNSILEEQVQNQKKQLEKLENRLQQCSDEVVKGNQIIEKLQSELGKQKEKIKNKNSVVLQQEQAVQQLQDNNDQLHKQLNEVRREKDTYEIRLREIDSQNQDLKAKLVESQKLIESNNQMIQYLNKCLNDSKAAPQMPLAGTFKSNTFSKYTNPLQEDKSFHNTSVQYPQQNISQLSNATISNRFNF
ncbi:hypothetical protein pb186bvf_008758 [Paramecium bursaria]